MKGYIYSVITDKRGGFIIKILKQLLFFLSLIYWLALRFMLFCYHYGIFKRRRLGCKVISVGNITLGGTGKTPLVETISRRLTDCGRKVAILSRGYKRSAARCKNMGDEPLMLKRNLPGVPILVGRDRFKWGKEAIKKFRVDTIVLDDGFQHWRLFRDLDIVVIDATSPFGNNKILPRGTLREPISSLRRAHILLLTKVDLAGEDLVSLRQRLKKVNPKAMIVESVHRPLHLYELTDTEVGAFHRRVELSYVKGRRVCLLSSIGEPNSFEKTLLGLGARVILSFSYPDHYEYRIENLKEIAEENLKYNVDTIVTTEKDAVRLPNISLFLPPKFRLLVLRVELQITKNEQEFFSRLLSLY